MTGLFCVVVTAVLPLLTACQHCMPLYMSRYWHAGGVGSQAFYTVVVSAHEYPGPATVSLGGSVRGGSG